MSRQFIKKEGLALMSLSRYLLGEREGCRLKTINELSETFSLSVGIVQAALKQLEHQGDIILERRGRNGTLLAKCHVPNLLKHADVGNLVCAMPLPYTKLYEGLASGLKSQLSVLPFYFAHMRGAEVRMECLIDGIYDMALVSRLAAEHYLQQQKVTLALSLGKQSYVTGHQLTYRQGERHTIQRVGVDSRSPDQRLLTEITFSNQPITLVETPYSDCLARIENGEIDAAIWNIVEGLKERNLAAERLQHEPHFEQATEAVILTRADNPVIKLLLDTLIDTSQLLMHQHAVMAGEIIPSY